MAIPVAPLRWFPRGKTTFAKCAGRAAGATRKGQLVTDLLTPK
jgi:hypothetical protein